MSQLYKEIVLVHNVEADDPADRVMTDSFTDDKYLIEREGDTVSVTHIRETIKMPDGKKVRKYSDKTLDFPWASIKRAVR